MGEALTRSELDERHNGPAYEQLEQEVRLPERVAVVASVRLLRCGLV